jgi:hypothetical protein
MPIALGEMRTFNLPTPLDTSFESRNGAWDAASSSAAGVFGDGGSQLIGQAVLQLEIALRR